MLERVFGGLGVSRWQNCVFDVRESMVPPHVNMHLTVLTDFGMNCGRVLLSERF